MLYIICTNVTTLSVKVIIIGVVHFAGATRTVITGVLGIASITTLII